ncbi:hypothetical protein [Halorubrum halodurans]|uniref:Uncharacterized protein n=1 Tax=Halorubrum halodurans TaxID=1383851 RepID=A0A256IEC1_9EURY|nr:hypothetical protein [Halorubrum halodurans]OYR54895.1 hypothetical protein DJ70_12760 [Halorubrum halodurans]
MEVTTYGGKRAIIQDDVYDELVGETGNASPVAFVGGRRYPLYPDGWITHNVVALPEDRSSAHGQDALLISKGNGREVFSL